MLADAKSWYITREGDSSLYQGDILEGVPVVVMPPASGRPWTILKPSPPVSRDQALLGMLPKNFYPRPKEPDPEVWVEQQELVLAKGIKTRIAVLTQSCDLVHRNYIQVAPVYSSDRLGDMKQQSLRLLDIVYMFYLPPNGANLPESYVDLSQIVSIHRSYLKTATAKIQLSATATIALQTHLADFFGRPFGFNIRDLVPSPGSYVCINCFHTRLAIQQLLQVVGEPFRPCPGCGGDALWLRLP